MKLQQKVIIRVGLDNRRSRTENSAPIKIRKDSKENARWKFVVGYASECCRAPTAVKCRSPDA